MELIAALTEICRKSEQPIIAIDGPAGAGKTTLASTLSLALSKEFTITVIHMDDLYPGWEGALGAKLTEALVWIASSHKARKDLIYSPFNWAENNFDSPRLHPSTSLLILEGVGSSQRIIEEYLSTSIWLDIDPSIGFKRVVERDGDEISQSMSMWLDQQMQHFATQDSKERSEFVLST